MNVDAQTLLDALDGKLSAARIASLTADLRQLPPAEILSLTQQANLSITGDGNIVGDNNVSIVVKGEGAAELASVLREALYRGRALYQLRPPVGDFVGCEMEIQELMTALRSNQAAAISGISGMGGIGKTELALYVADKLRAEYPDAQLFVSLRGTDPEPRSTADALQSCLRALVGVEAKLPEEVEDLTQLYRSQLSGKRALILLDNAADSAQVKPLLPPTGCALLVTSRTVLALPGSKSITLDQLQPAEARTLLCSIASHLTADVADSIAYLCGYLPLALQAAARQLQQRDAEGRVLDNLGTAYYSLGAARRGAPLSTMSSGCRSHGRYGIAAARAMRAGTGRWRGSNWATAHRPSRGQKPLSCLLFEQIDGPNGAKVIEVLAEWKAPASPNGEDRVLTTFVGKPPLNCQCKIARPKGTCDGRQIEAESRFSGVKFPVPVISGNSLAHFRRTRGSYCRLSQLPPVGQTRPYFLLRQRAAIRCFVERPEPATRSKRSMLVGARFRTL